MKKILENKKIVLLITLLLLLIVTGYIKTSEIKLDQIYQNEVQTENELLFDTERAEEEKDKKTEKSSPARKIGSESAYKKSDKKLKISKIALISEIKDPFKSSSDFNSSQKETAAGKELDLKSKKDYHRELIDLEKSIMANSLIEATSAEEKTNEQRSSKKSELNNKKSRTDKSTTAEGIDLSKVKLPFKLLGIIKNGSSSAALFQHQGRKIVKKERDKIGSFKIQEIKNKEIVISYQKAKRIINLWEEEKNEN